MIQYSGAFRDKNRQVLKRQHEFCKVLDKCKYLNISCSVQICSVADTQDAWSENNSLCILAFYLLKWLEIIVSYYHVSPLPSQDLTKGEAVDSQAGWSCRTFFSTNCFQVVFSVSDGSLDITLLCIFSYLHTNFSCIFGLLGTMFLYTYIL